MEYWMYPWISGLVLLVSVVCEGYNISLCVKISVCLTEDLLQAKVSENWTQFCVLLPKYDNCVSNYLPHCPEAEQNQLKLKYDTSKCRRFTRFRHNSKSCSESFRNCASMDFMSLIGKPDATDELCRQAPGVIQCLKNTLNNVCQDKQEEHRNAMLTTLAKLSNNLNCDNKSSRTSSRVWILLFTLVIFL